MASENDSGKELVKWTFHYLVEGPTALLTGAHVAASLGRSIRVGRVSGLISGVPPEAAGLMLGVLLADMAMREYTGSGLTERMYDTTEKIINKFYTLYSKIRNKFGSISLKL